MIAVMLPVKMPVTNGSSASFVILDIAGTVYVTVVNVIPVNVDNHIMTMPATPSPGIPPWQTESEAEAERKQH